MCTGDDEAGLFIDEESYKKLADNPSLEDYVRHLCRLRGGWRRAQVGFIGYGGLKRDGRVLIAVTNHHERELIDALVKCLREEGARSIDVLVTDWGEDRELEYEDEIRWIMRTEPWWENPRWYDYDEKIIAYAEEKGYDMLIHGRGGPMPKTKIMLEGIPWTTRKMFLDKSTIFPPRLNYLINKKTWNIIYNEGRGGKVRVYDPEGTDIEFTLNEKYYERSLDERGGFGPEPALGHLFGHPTPPLIDEEDAIGVVAGTTNHLSRPFPRIEIRIEGGRIEEIRGGGRYGELWREMLYNTSDIHYPEFPRKGLFWLWELAIGTNPKVRRQQDVLMIHSGGFEWERNRSGVIHIGFGTRWRGPSERWAAERRLPYGHLHVHLLFPTYEIKTKRGDTLTVIENGHLTTLDDPEVRDLAARYGDPDEILREEWIPKIPGITAPGSYEEDYAKDPYSWIKKNG